MKIDLNHNEVITLLIALENDVRNKHIGDNITIEINLIKKLKMVKV